LDIGRTLKKEKDIMHNNPLAVYLRRLFAESGKRLWQISNELGINYSYLSRLINGWRLPSAETLCWIGKQFDLAEDERDEMFRCYRKAVEKKIWGKDLG